MDETNEVSVGTLNELGMALKEAREHRDAVKGELEELTGKVREIEASFLTYLEQNNMRKYFVPGYGTVYTIQRLSYKVPKTPQERCEFFNHLKDKGIYEDLITVHSQTLNSWAKKEIEVAKEMGATDFKIPGLGEPNYSETLGVKKS